MTIHSQTEKLGAFAQNLKVRDHALRADVSEELGGSDAAPSPHCPIHKLMTTTEVSIETAPLERT
jgi:hypothetical protein